MKDRETEGGRKGLEMCEGDEVVLIVFHNINDNISISAFFNFRQNRISESSSKLFIQRCLKHGYN